MVHLILSTTKGNSSTRPFPHQGYLGLTPVRVDGIVSVRLDEDKKPINAKSLTVSLRAYEARQGRVGGAPHSRLLVDYTQTLWRKPDGQEYAELAELNSPFKITLPKRVAGFSTVNLLDYRTYWRLEVVLEHESLASVGTRLTKHADILLVRYDTPSPLPSLPVAPQTTLPTLSQATNKPRAPVLHYNLSTPTFPIGPSDLVFTSIFIQPADPGVSIRSASLLIERRIDLHEIEGPAPSSVSSPSSPSPFAYQASTTPQPIAITSSAPESSEGRQTRHSDLLAHGRASRSTMTIDSNASSATITSRTPLMNSPSVDSQTNLLDYSPHPPATPVSPSTPSEFMQPRKSLVSTVAAAEGAGFTFDRENGVWSKTISCAWPASRSHWKWGMGETMRGGLGAVTFWVRAKVIVTSAAGTESIELTPSEILVVPTNDAERRQAAARYAEARASSKARSSHSRNGEPSETSHGASTAEPERPRSPSEIAYFRYAPPKSAEVSSSAPPRISSKKHPLPSTPTEPSSSAVPSGSTSSGKTALSTFSKVIPSKKKSRRPHTSAGPRDGADIPMGLAIPIPVPVPTKSVSSNGYLSSSSSSSADFPPSIVSTRHKRRSSSGRHFFSKSPERESRSGSSSAPRSPPQPPPRSSGGGGSHPDENSFRTLNTNFTGLNGIGGPGAMALVWNQHQQRLDVEEWKRQRARERDEQSRELARAWEEELAQTEKTTGKRRASGGNGGSGNVLGFLGVLGRRKAKAGAS